MYLGVLSGNAISTFRGDIVMKDDKIIARIRAVRKKISAQFGHDPKKLAQFFMKRQQKHKNRLLGAETHAHN